MHPTFLRLATMITLFSTVAAMAAPVQAAGNRALWVWDGPVDGVVEFAADKGVSDLYLHTPPGFSTDARYRSFLEYAHGAGMRVHAMAGDPAWSKDPDPWQGWVDEVVELGGFDGVVFDVEPYLLAEWNTRRQSRLIRSYLSALDKASRRAGELQTIAAVPFWWDDPDYDVRRRPLVGEVLARVDGLVVMAYRDRAAGPDGIVGLAQTEVAMASAAGKTAVIGIETGPAGLDKVTFFEEGEAVMEAELHQVEEAFAGWDAYRGIAVHHYGAYQALLP